MRVCRQRAQNAHRLKLVGGQRGLRVTTRIRRCKTAARRMQLVRVLKLSGPAEPNFPAGFSVLFGVCAKTSRKSMDLPGSFNMGRQSPPSCAAARLASLSCGSALCVLLWSSFGALLSYCIVATSEPGPKKCTSRAAFLMNVVKITPRKLRDCAESFPQPRPPQRSEKPQSQKPC